MSQELVNLTLNFDSPKNEIKCKKNKKIKMFFSFELLGFSGVKLLYTSLLPEKQDILNSLK